MKKLVLSLPTPATFMPGGALNPPAATPAEPTPTALTDVIVGAWLANNRPRPGSYYTRFDKDVIFRSTNAVAALDYQPSAVNSYEFKEKKLEEISWRRAFLHAAGRSAAVKFNWSQIATCGLWLSRISARQRSSVPNKASTGPIGEGSKV